MVTVPLLLGALALLVAQDRYEKQQQRKQVAALAQTLVQAVDSELNHATTQLKVIAATRVIDQQDWQELYRFGKEVTRDRPGSLLILVDSSGQQLVNTAASWGDPLPNVWTDGQPLPEIVWEGRPLPLSSQNLTKTVFENKVVFSDLYYGLAVKRPTLSVAAPVVREGKVVYALTLAFPPSVIDQLIRASVDVPGLRVTVVDRNGLIVATNAASSSRLGDRASPIKVVPETTKGFFETTARDQVRVDGAYAFSQLNGFLIRVSFPAAEGFAAAANPSTYWLLLVVCAVFASATLAGLLGRRMARPLQELGQAARDGLPPRGPPTGIAEIDLLAQALRAGAESEHKRRDELVISAQRMQSELELRKADRQKDEFLATLAHELRNPLAPIRHAVELIRQRRPTDPAVVRARSIIERQALHLSRLVDDLLEISRISTGTIELKPEPLELRGLVDSVVESVRPLAEAAGLTLNDDLGSEPVNMVGDPTRLAQCVVNLLNNAIKFTPKGGRIDLSVTTTGHTASIDVIDNGIGISRDNLDKIFGLFIQENPSGSQGRSGLGVGLALTRKLVALHGGKVSAMSGGAGQGSHFRIELPLHEATAASQESPSSNASSAEAAALPVPSPATGDTAAQTMGEEQHADICVLVIDDNKDAADTLSEMLGVFGFATTVAYTGEAGVRAVRARKPDAVLLDIGLPDIDGYEVCRRIRAMTDVSQPVVVAVTGWGGEQDRRQAAAAGFDAHVTKPTDPERVLTVLKELVTAKKTPLDTLAP